MCGYLNTPIWILALSQRRADCEIVLRPLQSSLDGRHHSKILILHLKPLKFSLTTPPIDTPVPCHAVKVVKEELRFRKAVPVSAEVLIKPELPS
jgi:hypothetical protein